MSFEDARESMTEAELRNEKNLRKSKLIFLFLNSVILLFTIVLICLMVSLNDYWTVFDPFLHVYTEIHSFGVLFTGSSICVVALFGYLISYLGKKTHYVWYGLCLVLIIIMEIKTLIYGALSSNKAERYVEKLMNTTLYNYEEDIGSKKTMDFLQLSLECCGIRDKKDWLKSPLGFYPWSCCRYLIIKDEKVFCEEKNLFSDVCLPKLLQYPELGVSIIYSILCIMLCLKVLNLLTSVSIYYKKLR